MADDERRLESKSKKLFGAGSEGYQDDLDGSGNEEAPRILAVDDSRLVRASITACLNDHGYETLEAESGKAALELLENENVDLILLDIMMPNIDGPGFLGFLRERGQRTPVILLTGKTDTRVISRCIRQGVSDFILKPVKPEELVSKISNIVGTGAILESAKKKDDLENIEDDHCAVLLVDDSEKVGERLRSFLPEKRFLLETSTDGEQAQDLCRDMRFNTIVIDTAIPGEDSTLLAEQIRSLQPSANVLALYLRNVADPMEQALQQGYDGFLVKPFDREHVNEVFDVGLEEGELLVVKENVLRALAGLVEKEGVETYFMRLRKMIGPAIEGVAANSFEKIIFDFSALPVSDTFEGFVATSISLGRELGLQGCVVVGTDASASLEDAGLAAPVFASVKEAKKTGDW